MTSIEVYTCTKSNAFRSIYGNSTNGNVSIDSIERLAVPNSDELLIQSLKQSDPEKTLIVLYGNLKTSLEAPKILDCLDYFINHVGEYDVFFLSRYLDDCRLHTDFHTRGYIDYFKVGSPNGIEALMISPAGKTKLIGKLKPSNGRGVNFMLNAMSAKMSNYSSFPLIYHVDVSKEDSDSERIKSITCREKVELIKPPKSSTRNSSILNFLWFILVLIFLLWFGLFCTSESKPKVNPKVDADTTSNVPIPTIDISKNS